MRDSNIRRTARITAAMAVLCCLVGTQSVRASAPDRAPLGTRAFEPALFGNADGGAGAIVQDSTHRPPKRDTTGQWVRDSIYHARMDSLEAAEQVRDSLNRVHMDSLNQRNHVRDSINRAFMDSLMAANRVRDSINRAYMDSLMRANHVRDSINEAQQDSLMHARRDSLGTPPRDSIAHGRLDSLHLRDSILHVRIDSLLRARIALWRLRDSLIHARLDSLRHHRDSTHGGIGGSPSIPGIAMQTLPATPQQFDMAQNYPNPFGGGAGASTAISFSLGTSQAVSLVVYDAAGQPVTTIVNGALNAGPHTVTFDATTLPDGVYFYKLTSSQGSLTKRMVKLH